jgi:hypothetical protein
MNVAGLRESKEVGVYDWTLTMLRLFLNRTGSGSRIHRNSRRVGQEEGDRQLNFLVNRYFRLEPGG